MPGTPIQLNDNGELVPSHSSMVASQSLTPNTVTPGLVTAVDAVFAPVEGRKRPGFWDYLWKNRSGWGDLEASQNNPVFQDSLKKAVTLRTKTYTGWERDPATGKWRKADSKAAQALDMANTMQSGGTGGRMNPLSDTTMNTIKDGVGAGIKSSITWQDVVADPRSSFQLWAKSNGWDGLENFSKDPTKFWGTLAVGAIGVPLIVSAFLAGKDNDDDDSRKQSGTAINNYYGNTSVPPASTSFWRQPNGDNNNGIS